GVAPVDGFSPKTVTSGATRCGRRRSCRAPKNKVGRCRGPSHGLHECRLSELRGCARLLPPAPSRRRLLRIVRAAPPTRIAILGVPIALEEGAAVVAPEIVARNEVIGRGLTRYEAALGLVAQHRDKLGAIVGLGAQRLVRDDDRGSRQRSRPDA